MQVPLNLGNLLQIVTGKGKKAKAGGASITPTHNVSSPQNTLTLPLYREHLTDLFASRQSDDSRVLLKSLFTQDPDVSATVNIYLTLANTEPLILVRDLEGKIDADATAQVMLLIKKMTMQTDYTLGFQLNQSFRIFCENLRYMELLRGAIGFELIMDKTGVPEQFRMVDMASVRWLEKQPGVYKPQQVVSGKTDPVSLDTPTFFVGFYRRDPTSIYTYSSFVSAINTIAARQQVINDLYRIMQVTGYPRFDLTVLEEVLNKNMPANVATDPDKAKAWRRERLAEIKTTFENIRVDQAFVHFDSLETKIVNDKKPGMAVDIKSVVDTLNAQNQAGLKTMATVIGRGEQGVNTGSVEARVAAMNADELNEPIADALARAFSWTLHQTGYQGFCEVSFRKAELRPDLELEPQMTLKQSRLRTDLSDGLITDEEYHLEMYGRLPPAGVPPLSGTKFLTPAPPVGVDAKKVSPNSDPLGRSLAPEGAKAQK